MRDHEHEYADAICRGCGATQPRAEWEADHFGELQHTVDALTARFGVAPVAVNFQAGGYTAYASYIVGDTLHSVILDETVEGCEFEEFTLQLVASGTGTPDAPYWERAADDGGQFAWEIDGGQHASADNYSAGEAIRYYPFQNRWECYGVADRPL